MVVLGTPQYAVSVCELYEVARLFWDEIIPRTQLGNAIAHADIRGKGTGMGWAARSHGSAIARRRGGIRA